MVRSGPPRRDPAARQLALDLAPDPRFGVDDFLVSGCNEAAYAMVELWPAWPDRVLLLCGPAGAGKSHLGAIWAARAEASVVAAAAPSDHDRAITALAGAALLEDADRAGWPEEVLFHLVNRVREGDSALLITARTQPAAWGLRTADLVSRLRLAPIVHIGPPDDALLRAILVKLFIDRQLVVDTGLIDYVALRLDRSFEAARRFVDAIDREALARGRRVTRAIAADVLKDQEGETRRAEGG